VKKYTGQVQLTNELLLFFEIFKECRIRMQYWKKRSVLNQ